MRHLKAGRKFSRTSSHRDAMFSNMVASLVLHERITTTEPKAKELRRYVERTISWGTRLGALLTKDRAQQTAEEKAQIVHAIRMARRTLKQPEALDKLFKEVAPRFVGRPGGYTRVLKLDPRKGDAAPMALVELTERRAPVVEEAPEPKAKGGKAEAKAAPEAAGEGETKVEKAKKPAAKAAPVKAAKAADKGEKKAAAKKPAAKKPEAKAKAGKSTATKKGSKKK